MKKTTLFKYLFSLGIFTSWIGLPDAVFSQELHVIKIESTAELHDFFQYTGEDIPLISGHRGGTVEGYPENSIAAFEYTLAHTPAFFEIDPRLTKDSVIVLMHDATIDRTTNGSGKLMDYTWEELQQFNLVDHLGNVTPYKIPSLEEVIQWSKGKTIINLDRKDVPLEMTADIIERHQAASHVMLTVHRAKDAGFYLARNKDAMFSAFIRTREEFEDYEKERIPWRQIMAYVGPWSKKENKDLYNMLHERGVMVMVSAASSYDKLDDNEERMDAYRKVIKEGADVLESDFPVEAAEAIEELVSMERPKRTYFGKIIKQ